MGRLRALWMQGTGVFRAGHAEDDFEAELAAHVDLHTEEGMRAGLPEGEARRQALLRLGGIDQTRQAYRERRGLPWLENLLQDLRYGLRTLRRTPGFTATAVLTLGLGIGACTAVFSMVNAVLLRSLPYGDPERLVYLFTPNSKLKIPAEVICPSYGDLRDIEQQNRSFERVAAYEQNSMLLASQGPNQGPAQRVGGARVDASFFSTLESAPELGRALGTADTRAGYDKVAVISHSLWLSMFGGRTDALGHSLRLDDADYRIVGVMAPGFEYPFRFDLPYGHPEIKATEVWVPLVLTAKQSASRGIEDNVAIARLRPGVSIKHAQAEMSAMMARLDHQYPGEMRDWGALVDSFTGISIGPVRPLMRLLLGTVALVLLIACGNAANLLLARAAGRARELGVRAALGAGRGRLLRQLVAESLLIGIAGGVVGIALTELFLRLLPRLDPGNIPRLNQASLDPRVLLVALAVSLLTSLITGVLPALSASRLHLTDFLRTHATSGRDAGHSRLQSGLIAAETAMVVVLLAAAGLLIRTYINVESVDTGFSPSTVTMNLSLDREPQAGRAALFKSVIDKMSALPGVSAAGAVNHLPLTHTESLSFFWVDGFANQKDQLVESRLVTPRYFDAMGIPVVAGRAFTDEDAASTTRPAIVNEQFAKTYFAGRNAIGARVSTDDGHKQWSTVIGVLADVRHTSLEEPAQPQIYTATYDFDGASIAVRSLLPPATVVASIRARLKSIDPELALADIHTMGDLVSQASAQRRFQTSLLTAFAGIALLLALVGLYGLMAYSVNRRTREVGIRMALGAQRSDVLMMILKNAGVLLGVGLVAGLICSWVATQAMRSFLFGVPAHDPITIAAVCVLLIVGGTLAALVPARRAASIDPMQALRME